MGEVKARSCPSSVGAERVRIVASYRAAARDSGQAGDGRLCLAEAGSIAELLAQRSKKLAAVNRSRNRGRTKVFIPIRDHKANKRGLTRSASSLWAGFLLAI